MRGAAPEITTLTLAECSSIDSVDPLFSLLNAAVGRVAHTKRHISPSAMGASTAEVHGLRPSEPPVYGPQLPPLPADAPAQPQRPTQQLTGHYMPAALPPQPHRSALFVVDRQLRLTVMHRVLLRCLWGWGLYS